MKPKLRKTVTAEYTLTLSFEFETLGPKSKEELMDELDHFMEKLAKRAGRSANNLKLKTGEPVIHELELEFVDSTYKEDLIYE